MKIVLIKRVNFKYASKKKLYLLVNTSISLLISIETNFYMKNYGDKYIRVCFIRDDRISIVFLRFDETFSEQLIDYPCFEIFEIANIFQIVLSNIYLSIVTIYCILFPRWLLFELTFHSLPSLRYNLTLPDLKIPNRTSSRTVRISRGLKTRYP